MTASRRDLALAAGALMIVQALAFGASAMGATTGEQSVQSGATPATATSGAPATVTSPAPLLTQATATHAAVRTVTLSNERTSTTWAHPVEEARIREHPNARSRTIARIHLETEDGFPEVYLLLARLTDARGNTWVRLRIPGRPNGRIGWVRRSALGDFHLTHWLIEISLGAHRLRLYYKGRLRFSAPVGVGKPSTPTPTGRFWIRERFKLSSPSNPYWPYALGTSDYSTLSEWPDGGVVGIHGDFGEPQLIPGNPSHGCVRMHDGDIAWLAPRVQLGTPVHITR